MAYAPECIQALQHVLCRVVQVTRQLQCCRCHQHSTIHATLLVLNVFKAAFVATCICVYVWLAHSLAFFNILVVTLSAAPPFFASGCLLASGCPHPPNPQTSLQRQRRAVEAVYEARPVPKDHQVPGDMQGASWNVS